MLEYFSDRQVRKGVKKGLKIIVGLLLGKQVERNSL